MAVSPLTQRQKDDLLVREACRSEEKNLQPLTKLAMRSVKRNIDHFASLDRPFEDLPRSVLEDMLSYEPLADLLESPKFAHLMITKHTNSVILDFDYTDLTWTECDVERVCALVEKSSATLRKLVISLDRTSDPSKPKIQREGAPQLSTARLHQLLGHLHHLDTFKCDLAEFCAQEDCGVTNATLTVLATNCPKLRFLMVSGSRTHCSRSETITKEGVIELCAACPELEVLDIPLPPCVTDCVQFVLPLLPRLWRLHFPYKLLNPSELLSHIEHHGATHPQLRYGLELNPQKPEEVDIIAKAFPRCQNLSVYSCSNLDLTAALKFKELRDLSLTVIEGENIGLQESFLDLLAQRSFKSFWLDRITNFSLDLSLLGHHCPELETLNMMDVDISEKKPQYQIKPYHFLSLKDVFLSDLTPPPAALPVVAKMFASPNLEELQLSNMSVPDVVFSGLVQEAREHRQIFSSLRMIALLECRVRPETLIDVLLQAPRLWQLTLNKIDMEHYKAVVTFVRKHLRQRVFLMWEEDEGEDEEEEEEDEEEEEEEEEEEGEEEEEEEGGEEGEEEG